MIDQGLLAIAGSLRYASMESVFGAQNEDFNIQTRALLNVRDIKPPSLPEVQKKSSDRNIELQGVERQAKNQDKPIIISFFNFIFHSLKIY